MRRLILTTVSVIALGLGGVGLTYAADNTGGSKEGASVPNTATTSGTPQTGNVGTNPGAPGTSNVPSNAGTSQSGYSENTAGTGAPHRGMSGAMGRHSEAMEVQQKLQQEGLYHGKIDGRIGRETKQALREYQRQNSLRVTARLDRETLDHLLGNASVGQGSSNPPQSSNNMSPHRNRGNTGAQQR
jgi:Putative peptidoglycan binding domain